MEEHEMCVNCQKDIPVSNYRTHTLHCAKNVLKCRECDVVVPGGNIQAHNQEAHTLKLCDMCQIKVEAYKMPEHKRTLCSKRTLPCRYCTRQKVVTALSEHESYCGNKTEQCKECYEWIMLKEWDTHQNKIHGSFNKRFAEKSGATSVLEMKASTIRGKQTSQFDTVKGNASNLTLSSEDPMLPCEFCDGLVPMRKLLEHQAECVNPTNVRRNDSCSSMLSRNSSSSSSVRPSHSNTSTSLNRSTSSVNTHSHGKHGTHLAPPIGNGDSGCCTSPRPESTQSTISNISCSTKLQNGHSTSNEETKINRKNDPQDERVPCEFCGELRCKETIMRHQRHCSLNPRRSAVEVTANTTYDTTSLRRSQARRNYSLNRTNSVREARATTEDRTFGGSRLSRQSSFSDRSYSRWRETSGTVNMGLSVVPKADFSSYGRLGRPGYDYAAATRRSGLFDGYTGFAIYSSISQGLDEITYGGRRSRRNSITENSFGTSGTSLSRRGSFANISDYSAMLAASAAVEAATKPNHTENDESCTKKTKDEKKKDNYSLDLSPQPTYSNSSKISRQSSVAYQSDSAFSESSPGLSSKRYHQHQDQRQTAKVSLGSDCNKHVNSNEKEVERDTTSNYKAKKDVQQLQQRTLSPSSLEPKPQSILSPSILSRQESLTHSQSTTKIERRVSFNEGPTDSPVQRPVSTLENDSKREKRKHREKDKEKDKDKEARREERRKRRELKEMKKAEKSKEREMDSLQGGESCGALLKEVSQKLLALEKEQQGDTDDRENAMSPKSPLELIPPSSLLSGINDERSSQIQILQKQKQQQQEHLREQQRLEQERIDEQKMLHQQQKWLLQNEARLNEQKQNDNGGETNVEESHKNNSVTHTCNALNENKGDLDVNAKISLTSGNVLISEESYSNVKDTTAMNNKDEAITILDSTIVVKQNTQDDIDDSGNGSDPSASSSPTTTTKKDHLVVCNNINGSHSENATTVVLREKESGKCTSTHGDKGASKRNSLDGKTVQGLAQDLAAECAKAYALMENSLSKFSNDFGPFGITPRNRKAKKKDAKE